MPTQRYISLQMLQDRALWELQGPRTRRASTAELRRRGSTNAVLVTHHSALSASIHRPVGKLVESTSDLSLLMAYVEAHGYTEDDAEQERSKDRVDVVKDEEVQTLEEDLVILHDEQEQKELQRMWQLPKEIMFMVSAFLVLFTSGGLILG
ncbi:Hypothetical protein PHPALM_13245 [Phytophthora palmivora]|uniref:Uncharacterized protein n=1 Tax=Phytophthora palmivora TaxID=4796 RepID=A0A2P4XXX5_9STRA|nr:Hypothetical protein PHPALM_13245 [Phytophthora palmivora]